MTCDSVYVLSFEGTVKYYSTPLELAKAITRGFGVVRFIPGQGMLSTFKFGTCTALFFDKPGMDLTEVVAPYAEQVFDYLSQAPMSTYDKFGRKVPRDAKEATLEANFMKSVRSSLLADLATMGAA